MIKYNLKNYPIFILDNLLTNNKDKVDEISNLDFNKEYKVRIACLSRFKNNIDSNPEKLIKSVIKSISFQDTSSLSLELIKVIAFYITNYYLRNIQKINMHNYW